MQTDGNISPNTHTWWAVLTAHGVFFTAELWNVLIVDWVDSKLIFSLKDGQLSQVIAFSNLLTHISPSAPVSDLCSLLIQNARLSLNNLRYMWRHIYKRCKAWVWTEAVLCFGMISDVMSQPMFWWNMFWHTENLFGFMPLWVSGSWLPIYLLSHVTSSSDCTVWLWTILMREARHKNVRIQIISPCKVELTGTWVVCGQPHHRLFDMVTTAKLVMDREWCDLSFTEQMVANKYGQCLWQRG